MSAREPCACTNGERRMSIMIVANHDIINLILDLGGTTVKLFSFLKDNTGQSEEERVNRTVYFCYLIEVIVIFLAFTVTGIFAVTVL